MRWRWSPVGRTGVTRGVRGGAVVAVMMLGASLLMIGGASANGGTTTTRCTNIFHAFSYDGGEPDTVTRSGQSVDGYVISASVELADFAHPESTSELGERVTIIGGGEVIGTSPDLPDDVVRTTLTFAVGRTLTFDEVTLRHAPLAVPDDVFIKKVCFEVGDAPSTTTTTTSTTTTTTTTTTAPVDTTTTTSSTTSTTTTEPVETTTTQAPAESTTTTEPVDTTTTQAPAESTTTSEPVDTTTTDAPSESTTTVAGPTSTSTPESTTSAPGTDPTTSTTVPPVPGLGSFSAECVSGATDAGTFVWTAAATVPGTVTPGTPLTLTQQVWRVVVPAPLLENARQLGLIEPGDDLDVVVGATITASDTVEGSQSQNGLRTTVTVADAGDGSAAPAAVVVNADDMVFTPTADRVEFQLSEASLLVEFPTAPVEIVCSFDPAQPPIVETPPGIVTGPPPGELAVTGPSPLLVAGIVVFVLLDVGYLAWSATKPRRLTL